MVCRADRIFLGKTDAAPHTPRGRVTRYLTCPINLDAEPYVRVLAIENLKGVVMSAVPVFCVTK